MLTLTEITANKSIREHKAIVGSSVVCGGGNTSRKTIPESRAPTRPQSKHNSIHRKTKHQEENIRRKK